MNPIKNAYCRTFQTLFRIAQPILPCRAPETLASIQEIPAPRSELFAQFYYKAADWSEHI